MRFNILRQWNRLLRVKLLLKGFNEQTCWLFLDSEKACIYLDKDINEVMNKINNIGYDSSVLPNMVEHFKTLE